MRLDKWLWAARFYKTRSLATRAIAAGQVRVNDARVKPAHEVKVDDVIVLAALFGGLEVRVRLLATVRSNAGVAQTLYAETEASLARREAERERRRLAPEPHLGQGRPTKRDRRELERWRGQMDSD